jgi:outer membrane PBP1 activator LpoA protein
MQLRRFPAHIIIALILAGLLAACGPVKPPTRTDLDPAEARAQMLLERQDFLGASALYRELAARNTGEAMAHYQLEATDAALKGGDLNTAEALLAQLAEVPLTPRQALHARLLRAELMFAQRRPDLALELLYQPRPADDAPIALQRRYLRDLANAFRLTGNLLDSANSLQELDALETEREKRLTVQAEILRNLALLNELVLRNLQPSPPGVAGGWMQLALLIKQYGDDPQALQPELQQWRVRFPDHPAFPEVISEYQARLQQQVQRAAQVAVLLPQSGRFAAAAAAVRDGLMISYYQLDPTQRPKLRFYDSADTDNVWPLYSQAVNDGAEIVVGPLQKEAVTQLSRAGELPIPVLALNQVQTDSTPPANLFMFALSPEDEARQGAERIWLDGLRRPVVLVPEGDWGERIARAFDNRWQSLGGSAVDYRHYDATSHDYSEAITSLLHLDQSMQRHRQIQQWLGQKVEFEPRRRQDVDAIFLAARPRQAQSFPPLLQFHHGGDLPLYATSHAWTGELSAQQLADMRGMMLADIPLLVSTGERDALARHLPSINSPLVRLHAMGMDALNLLPHLARLDSSIYESLDGHTGNLFMDPENRILRQTVWLKLDDPPQILGYAARLDLQNSGYEESPAVTPATSAPNDPPGIPLQRIQPQG